jgi:uncharacterized membrane protein YjfL (UPF0719 family)
MRLCSELAILLPLPSVSPDEVFVIVVAALVWAATWFWWYRGLRQGPRIWLGSPPRRLLALAPLASTILIFIVLVAWSSHDVRESPIYLFQYVALGAAWSGAAMPWLAWHGLSARDDVAERNNPAAAVALCGAILGVGLCYAGGNIGDGPGWWVVVFSAALATAAFFVLWRILDAASPRNDLITIHRDLACGLRHAGACVAAGLVLGRAVAGDWVSAGATLRDFAGDAWPVLDLAVVAVVVDRTLAPTIRKPLRSPLVHGALPAAAYVAMALLWLVYLGGWS